MTISALGRCCSKKTQKQFHCHHTSSSWIWMSKLTQSPGASCHQCRYSQMFCEFAWPSIGSVERSQGERFVKINCNRTRAQQVTQAIKTCVIDDCSRHHGGFPKTEGTTGIILPKGWSNSTFWSLFYTFLKKDSKTPFLGQCPFVQRFYKQLHLEMCESVTFSEK